MLKTKTLLQKLQPDPDAFPISSTWLKTNNLAARNHYRILKVLIARYLGPHSFYVNRRKQNFVEVKFKRSEADQYFWSVELLTSTVTSRVRFYIYDRTYSALPKKWQKVSRILKGEHSEDLHAIDLRFDAGDSLTDLEDLLNLSASFSVTAENGEIESDALEDLEGAMQDLGEDALKDERKKVLAEIVRREGQGRFRMELLHGYKNRCAISTCTTVDVLEAAHIVPYLGPGWNHVRNGILLRSDLHTLWDRGMLAIDPETGKVWTSPHLKGTEYEKYAGKAPKPPVSAKEKPLKKALKIQWDFAMSVHQE